ncbi:MAG: substrate-binding domain-containing protein [Lachnospiraceae bacterium]|nr:substrate-binding domain-containing protein [Lachnospiraceae bacterium]
MLLAAVLCLTGCSAEQQEESKAEEPVEIIAITKAMNSLHWQSVNDGMQQAAEEYNVNLTVLWPEEESDAETQSRILSNAAAMDPDILLLAPCSAADAREQVEAAADRGIEIVYMDEEPEGLEGVSYVGSDNYYAGVLAARSLAEALPEGAEVAVISGSQNQIAHSKRTAGFADTIAEESSLNCVNVVEVPDCSLIGGQKAMRELLEEYENLKGVFCTNALMVMGAAEQCQTEDRADLQLVGMDSQSDAMNAVKEGIILAMVSQNGYEIGYQAVEKSILQLQREAVGEITTIENSLITQDNAEQFLHEYVSEGRK